MVTIPSNSTPATDRPDIIAFPPLIFLIFALIGGGLHFLFPIRLMPYPASLSIGIVLVLVAATQAIWAVRVMLAAGTHVRPDKPALTIVRSGPYRFTRNPMYLSLCLLQVALGFILDDWLPLLLVIPLAVTFHFGVILREECYLEAKFGEPYLALKRQVRRWL